MDTKLLVFLMVLILPFSCRNVDCRYIIKNMSEEDFHVVIVQNLPGGVLADTMEIKKNSEKVIYKESGSLAGSYLRLVVVHDTVKVYIAGNLIVTWHEPIVNLDIEPRLHPYKDFFCLQDWDEFGAGTDNIKWVFAITQNDLLEFPGMVFKQVKGTEK